MGNGQWALGIKEAAVNNAILIRFFPCPMTADAPLGLTPPLRLPDQCPIPNALYPMPNAQLMSGAFTFFNNLNFLGWTRCHREQIYL